MQQEQEQMKIQNQRIKEICGQNLTLIRARVEQIFGWRLDIEDFEKCTIRTKSGHEINFQEYQKELRVVGANCLHQGVQGQVPEIVAKAFLGV